MEEGATYYRMQNRPAPSTHGVVQPAPVQRPLTKHSTEFLQRKQIFSQFPQEWKDDVVGEKDGGLRLTKFETYQRQLMGEVSTSQPQQQVVMNGGGGHQQVAGGQRQMPNGVMTNRTVHVVTRNPQQQPQTAEGYVQHSNGTPMMVRRAPVLTSDQPHRTASVSTVRVVGQQPVRGPNGARLLPARSVMSQHHPQQAPHTQFVRRVVPPSAVSASLEEPGAKRAKLTPSPPNYGQQQMVYVHEQGGQQQQPQQIVFIQGRAQSPNGTVYITRQQQGSDQVTLLREEPRGVEPSTYAQQQQQGGPRRQPVVLVRTADGQQQMVRRAAAGQSPQMAEGRMVSPPGVSTASNVPTSSTSALVQALHSGPPVLQRMDNPAAQRHQPQPQQHYLQPSGGTAMHKSSSMPIFSNASQMPRSPQVTSMRSPAPAYANVSSPGGQMVVQQQYQEQHTPMVQQQPPPQHQQQQRHQMVMQQQQAPLHQQPQHQAMQQQQPQAMRQQPQHPGMQQHQQNPHQRQQMQQRQHSLRKVTPEYKEAVEKLRSLLLEDFMCLARRQQIDGVKPSPKFDGVMAVLQMKKIVPIENLGPIGQIGAVIVEENRLAWPLTKELKEFFRAGVFETTCNVKAADPWESVRDKFVSTMQLPPEVLKAIN